MIKKTLLLLTALCTLALSAQVPTGTWKNHGQFLGSLVSGLIETPGKVYMASSGSLSCYDKQTAEVTLLNKSTGLSDVTVKNIYYNYSRGYLLVTYDNSNIDVIYDDGRMVNVSDLVDVVMNYNKGINDVTFAPGQAILATQFGYVVLNDSNWMVTDSRNYGADVNSVMRLGDKILLACNGEVLAGDDQCRSLNDYQHTGIAADASRFFDPGDGVHAFLLNSTQLLLIEADATAGQFDATVLRTITAVDMQPAPGGTWIVNGRKSKLLLTIGPALTVTASAGTSGSALYTSHPDGDGTKWMVDNNGLYRQGTTDYSLPNAVLIRPETASRGSYAPMLWLTYVPETKELYYQTAATNPLFTQEYNFIANIAHYDGENWSNATPSLIRNTRDITRLAVVPGHPEVYFTSFRTAYSGGIARVINGEVNQIMPRKGKSDGVPAGAQYAYPVPEGMQMLLDFDSQGNLWAATTYSGSKTMAVLTADKLLKDTIYSEDWKAFTHADMFGNGFQRSAFAIGAGDVKVIFDGYNYGNMVFLETDPTLTQSQGCWRDTWKLDDGTLLTPNLCKGIAADRDGMIWVGTDDGVFWFDPRDAFEDVFPGHTPMADGVRLLKGETVNAIAVDSLGRMWFGTVGQGVVVTNSEGTQILAQFSSDNCDMPSPMVYDLCVADQSVFVSTNVGLAEFVLNQNTGIEADYAHVGVTPAIVTPDYHGHVVVNSLEPGSFVRVTKRDGTVVKELTSTGADVAWDAVDDRGERLPAGVYKVYAGPDAASLPATPQAEVRIIR